MQKRVSKHYDEKYFQWQTPIGEFGGWAKSHRFDDYISINSRVLDFGCGGGFLLRHIKCGKKVGIEPNPAAAQIARQNGIEVFADVREIPDEYVNVIISDNALEHTLQPLEELMGLNRVLEAGGKIVFIVPCESISYGYQPDDINHHLYSWSPMCIGNLFTEAGFSVIESKPYMHKFPPKSRFVAGVLGPTLFEAACRVWGRLEGSWYNVKVVAEKKGE